MGSFQSPITIQQAIERINRNEFLLPAFQREFVWSTHQIEQLFDSIMQGYPISSMLFWKVKGDTKSDFRFYQFLKKYIQYYNIHNDSIATNGVNDFHAILDGQQRLTALYIGLCGSYAYHEYRRSNAYSEWSYPTRHLYLNITSEYSEDDSDKGKYIFKFIDKPTTKEQEIYIDSSQELWFRVGAVLDIFKNYSLDEFAEKNQLSKEAKKVINLLGMRIHTVFTINYYEEDEQVPDKAVNIFVRINSGGTTLSFSDILMSIAIASWKKDARTEINNLVDAIRTKGFNIDKNYVLKSFLVLYHKDVRFKITSFRNDFIENIELNWESIRNAIFNLFDLIKTFGLNDYTLTTKNATLPILYYIYHKGIYTEFSTKTCYKSDREVIRKWLLAALVRRTFGGQGDSILMQARRAFTLNIDEQTIGSLSEFPAIIINKEVRKFIAVGDDYIEELLQTQKDSQYSFSILALLYPDLDYKNNNFHQDHLHPAALYDTISDEDKQTYGWHIYNSILNLQMLDANENMSKNAMSLQDWITEQTKNSDVKRFMDSHIIPQNINLDLSNFSEYILKRKELLLNKLRKIIN
jgi:uncharacterized protein with ParB-like and HNH nuclease domain